MKTPLFLLLTSASAIVTPNEKCLEFIPTQADFESERYTGDWYV